MKITCELTDYLTVGKLAENIRERCIIIERHWADSGKVVIKIGNEKAEVQCSDLLKAIRACTE